MEKKVWTAPSLEQLDVTETLNGLLDQFAEGQYTGYTNHGQPVHGNGNFS